MCTDNMNFENKNENFIERHRYFFQGYFFKFEGLKPEIQTRFEDIVQNLSATVCMDADYTLVEESFFKKDENRHRTDLYSINYILDSMRAKKPLDINKYRFTLSKPLHFRKPCCSMARYVWRTNCLDFYYKNVRCPRCVDKEIENSVSTMNISDQTGDITNENSYDKSMLSTNIQTFQRKVMPHNKTESLTNTFTKRNKTDGLAVSSIEQWRRQDKLLNKVPILIMSDEESRDIGNPDQLKNVHNLSPSKRCRLDNNTEIYKRTRRCDNKNKENQNREQSVNSDNDLSTTTNENSSVEEYEGSEKSLKCNKQKVYKYKRKRNVSEKNEILSSAEESDVHSKKRKTSEKKCVAIVDSTSQSESSFPGNEETNESISDNSTQSSKSTEVTGINKNKESSDSQLSFSSDEDVIINSNQWWLHLPKLKNVDPNFVEPKRDRGDRRRGATFTTNEQKLMIAHLVTNNMIQLGTSRLPWRQMHTDGYLRHRSSESLNNHFRKTILPNIKKFKLPRDIENKFLCCKNFNVSK